MTLCQFIFNGMFFVKSEIKKYSIMNSLISFDPLNHFDSFFNDFFTNRNVNDIKVNVKEDEKTYNLDFSLPGFKKDDVQINIEHNVLTISSKIETNNNEEKDNYIRKEFSSFSFEKNYQLPENIDSENIKAKHENGILKIILPKTKEINVKKSIMIE